MIFYLLTAARSFQNFCFWFLFTPLKVLGIQKIWGAKRPPPLPLPPSEKNRIKVEKTLHYLVSWPSPGQVIQSCWEEYSQRLLAAAEVTSPGILQLRDGGTTHCYTVNVKGSGSTDFLLGTLRLCRSCSWLVATITSGLSGWTVSPVVHMYSMTTNSTQVSSYWFDFCD